MPSDHSDALSLDTIPNEILLKIYSYLSPEDLLKISQVNTHQQEIASSAYLWNKLLNEKFQYQAAEGEDPKTIYEEKYEDKYLLPKEFEACLNYAVEIFAINHIEDFKESFGYYADIKDKKTAKQIAIVEKIADLDLHGKSYVNTGKSYMNTAMMDYNFDAKGIKDSIANTLKNFISGDLIDAYENEKSEAQKNQYERIMQTLFTFLCKTGALTTIKHLLKGKIINYDDVFLTIACQYPRIGIIKAIVQAKKEIINKKSYYFNEESNSVRNITPLTCLILSLLEGVNPQDARDAILFMLAKGADKEATITLSDEEFTGTIEEYCKQQLALLDRFDADKGKFIAGVLKAIINYKPPATLNDLPPDMKVEIYSHLPIETVANITETCKKQNQTKSHCLWNNLWCHFLKRDFMCQVSDTKDSKAEYMGIYRERMEYVMYACIYSIVKRIENHYEKTGKYNDPSIAEGARQTNALKLKNRAISEQMASFYLNKDKASEFLNQFPDSKLTNLQKAATEGFNKLLSGEILQELEAYESHQDKIKLANDIRVALEILCRLNAVTTIRHLLKNKKLAEDYEDLFINAFKYPRKDIINAIIETKPEILNTPFWVAGKRLTAFVHAIRCLFDMPDKNISKEIILSLLEKGADPQTTISVQQGEETIANFCRRKLNELDKLSEEDREIVAEVLQTIINYRAVKATPSL